MHTQSPDPRSTTDADLFAATHARMDAAQPATPTSTRPNIHDFFMRGVGVEAVEQPEPAISVAPLTLNLVYIVGKRTSANTTVARHIAGPDSKPLCWATRRMSGKSYGHGYVRAIGEPTCKHCIRIAAQQAVNS